jgi:hypothetical protein
VGNAYARVRRLSSHPAFSFMATDARPLKCPLCGELFGRVPEYDKHYMTHKPTPEQAWEHLSWRSFQRRFPGVKSAN